MLERTLRVRTDIDVRKTQKHLCRRDGGTGEENEKRIETDLCGGDSRIYRIRRLAERVCCRSTTDKLFKNLKPGTERRGLHLA